ncbi:SMI1/KNR4 family protein [Archangium violaceum]|uniref:SMI1/KNR4 family protein n=1 Tax=Archangium violaceum TaxID=83451 RepID=UPI00193AF4A6|nr:SMI1/KNR4 family protein [Archangium violaceum]QRK09377.1 SMI1/KNR4 family protein [Archangium violaceum]
MSLQWVPYVWDELHPATHQEIERIEHELGITFPSAYKETVARYQGTTPHPAVFNVGRGTNVVGVLLTIAEDEKWDIYSVMRAHEIVKPHVPDGIYPFASTPGGEYLCFDYRTSPDQPKVVLVTVEMFIYPVANSFTEFMAQLHDGRVLLA